MVIALKKLLKLRKRRALGFAFVSFFTTIVLVTMHPNLAQATGKNIIGNSAMSTAFLINIFEILVSLLLAVSVVSALVGAYSMRGNTNSLSAFKASLISLLMGLLTVLGGVLFFEYWTPILVAIAWLNGLIFLVILEFALTH